MIKNIIVPFVILFTTSTQAQVEVFNEDFQSGLPASFTIVDNDGLTPDASVSGFDDAWVVTIDPSNANDTVMGSTSFFDPTGQADRWLITGGIALGAYGNILYWEAKSHDASFPDDYFVLISTTDTQVSSFTDTLYYVNGELATWNSRETNISDLGINSQTVYLAFVNRTDDGFKLYIDDIRVEIEDPVGLETIESTQLSIYPNPSSGLIQISGIKDVKSIELYALSGQLIQRSNTNSLDLTNCEAGRYIVVARNESTVLRSSVVKY